LTLSIDSKTGKLVCAQKHKTSARQVNDSCTVAQITGNDVHNLGWNAISQQFCSTKEKSD